MVEEAIVTYRVSPLDPLRAEGPEVEEPVMGKAAPSWLIEKEEPLFSKKTKGNTYIHSDFFYSDSKERLWIRDLKLVPISEEDREDYLTSNKKLRVEHRGSLRILHVTREHEGLIKDKINWFDRWARKPKYILIHEVVVDEE